MKKNIIGQWTIKLIGLFVLATLTAAGIAGSAIPCANAVSNTITSKYSYEITPLLYPFNKYFFVKTDNPDPLSFRFVDRNTKYSDGEAMIATPDNYGNASNKLVKFGDIIYDDPKTTRVDGGYIFQSGFNYTDGGRLTLQEKYSPYENNPEYVLWTDTNVSVTLPKLMDDADYLIKKYAVKSDFWENMDAVEKGMNDICVYNGSCLMGDLVKKDDNWFIFNSPYQDQCTYIGSPYTRENNYDLLGTLLYPFRYTSNSFPGIEMIIAKRLDGSCICEKDPSLHDKFFLTHNGETRCYGGAGEIEGQTVNKTDVKEYLHFGENDSKKSLKELRNLCIYYSKLNVDMDLSQFEGRISMKDVYDTLEGNGGWIRIKDYGNRERMEEAATGDPETFAYVYKAGDGSNIRDNPNTYGSQMYMGGDLDFATDVWADGRYIDKWESLRLGEKFEDHPYAGIVVADAELPFLTYDEYVYHDEAADKYEIRYKITNIWTEKRTVAFYYQRDGKWHAYYHEKNGPLIGSLIELIYSYGGIDKKYVDMVTMTGSQVKAMKPDRNTNRLPDTGYIYDGTAPAGTPFKTKYINESNTTVTFQSKYLVYNGRVQRPKITVKYNGKVLRQDIDYEAVTKNINCIDKGKYKLTVKFHGDYVGELTRYFRIVPAAESLSLTKSRISLRVGDSFTLKATTQPKGAEKGVVWKSSDPKIASVSGGTVTALRTGTAKITATTADGKKASCMVIVGKQLTNLSTISAVRINKGSSLEVKIAAIGGTSPYRAAVWYRNNDTGQWTKVQDYSTKTKTSFNIRQSGSYNVRVLVKDGSGKIVRKEWEVTVSDK